MLEQAGAHVVYGLVGLKTHARSCSSCARKPTASAATATSAPATTTRRPRRSTKTSACFSADPELGADLSELFNHLTGYSRPGELRRLIVAPSSLRPELTRAHPRAGAGRAGGSSMKMNALVDPEMIDELYDGVAEGRRDRPARARHLLPAPRRARAVGAHPRALDRRPLPRALADLPLRRRDDGPAEYVIGSADLMPRNLDRRVEAMLRVTDPRCRPGSTRSSRSSFADDVPRGS